MVSRGGDDTVASDIDFFQTFRAQGPVHFAFIADTGQNTAAQTAQAQVLARLAPELVLHGGDIIYGGFDDKTPDTRVFAQYLRQTGQMKNTPFYFTIGNHDLNCCGGSPAEWNPKDILLNAPHFQQTFYLPTNSATGTEHFYSFDQGDAHFVGLYNPWFTVYDFNATTLQYQWLTNDLAHSSKPWKILFFHSPIAHSGEHSLADRNVNGILDQVEVMQLISQASRSYGVQLVLCGHDHNFERFAPTNGLHAVVAGGGGAGLYQFTSRHPLSSQFLKVNHCLNIEIVGDTASVQTVTTNGVILDQFVIHRSLPLEPTYYSEWNTPRVEVDPANDKDGNINGQTFDLIGKPILPRHGDFSNLGFAYVNNDSTNLYVGFASVMIPDDANVFLFAGSSRRSGVETMNGVGNGVIDPLGEGVDGLDCLENLAFSGFRPLVGCVLGDEFGDSNLRSSLRPSLTLNIGQGVFGLGPRLDPVVGSRLQQFNRSPQTNALDMRSTSAAYEQNADYIEVAIPFSALGDVIPGDTIQLAALVGLRGYDPAAMTRSLDNAALASSVTVRSDGMTVVAPIQVKLAFPKDLDTDGDGLPDAWEIANGLRPDDASGDNGAAGDPDQDGDSNLREFLAGTDPRDPNSSLRIRLVPTGDSRFRLQWAPVVGRRLTIQYASPDPVGFGDYFRAPEAPRAPLFKAVLTEDLRGRSGPYQRYYRLRLDP